MINLNNIPKELQELKRWALVVSKENKIPKQPNLTNAMSNNSETWSTYEEVIQAIEEGKGIAPAFCLTDSGYAVLDIDNHPRGLKENASLTEQEEVDVYNTNLEVMVERFTKQAVNNINTYVETSLSGKGTHALIKGAILEDYQVQSAVVPLEIFNNKFIILTGNTLTDYDISNDNKEIQAFHQLQKMYFLNSSSEIKGELKPILDEPLYTDKYVLENAINNEKFNLLWNDRWEEVLDSNGNQLYGTQHYADFALMAQLIFYTKNCPIQAKRLFRQSPTYKAYGQNGKWSKYASDIENDAKKASSNCTIVYDIETFMKGIKDENGTLVKKSEEEIIEELIDFAKLEEDSMSEKELEDSQNVSAFTQGMIDNGDFGPWKPTYESILKRLNSVSGLYPGFVGYMYKYIAEYRYEDITYHDGLYEYDKNIDGYTKVAQEVLGETMFYSKKTDSYMLWNGKKYEELEPTRLTNIFVETLKAIKHSIFKKSCEILDLDDTTIINTITDKNGKEIEITQRDNDIQYMENLWKLITSHIVINSGNAKDIEKNLKGINSNIDIIDYKDTKYLNMQNGVLDLETFELLPHNPEYRLNKVMACNYDPEAAAPEFEAMLERMIPDLATRNTFIRAIGLTLTKEHFKAKKSIFMLQGLGDTGKTTLSSSLQKVFGDDYGTVINPELLLNQKFRNKNVGPEMIVMREKLFIATSELQDSSRIDSAFVKNITGNMLITCRNNHATSMATFPMIGLIFLDTNDLPVIPATDTPMWNRAKIFPFEQVIKQENMDMDIYKKLEREIDGIFNIILKGYKEVMELGELVESEYMLKAKNTHKDEMSAVKNFLSDCVNLYKGQTTERVTGKIRATQMYETFVNWCSDNNQTYTPRKALFDVEMDNYLTKVKSSNIYFNECEFSRLGDLYSRMKEMKKEDFNKTKNSLYLHEEKALGNGYTPTYTSLKQSILTKSALWVAENIVVEEMTIKQAKDMYLDYANHMIYNLQIPLTQEDYGKIIKHMFDRYSLPSPTDNIIYEDKTLLSIAVGEVNLGLIA